LEPGIFRGFGSGEKGKKGSVRRKKGRKLVRRKGEEGEPRPKKEKKRETDHFHLKRKEGTGSWLQKRILWGVGGMGGGKRNQRSNKQKGRKRGYVIPRGKRETKRLKKKKSPNFA